MFRSITRPAFKRWASLSTSGVAAAVAVYVMVQSEWLVLLDSETNPINPKHWAVGFGVWVAVLLIVLLVTNCLGNDSEPDLAVQRDADYRHTGSARDAPTDK